MGMHISQQDPRELEDIAAAFMARPMVTHPSRDPDYIFNMDAFSYSIHF